MGQIFRFDDVSINTDMDELNAMTDLLIEKGWEVMWAVSLLVYKDAEKGRVFPKNWPKGVPDKYFFTPNQMGMPKTRGDVEIASHGLIHINHRYLTKEQLTMSVVISCSILGTRRFIPPFGQWPENYPEIFISRNDIIFMRPIIVESQEFWVSAEHEQFKENTNFYAHPYAFGLEQLKAWLP